ncbi:adhesion G-protein coupled receptor G1-like isoform X1 [Phycodurus eques]|uniref:adhesion G-protein coupled receptor G1-like isoform X1 n=1 Tax=Phycodurus eques TaxID=693459 RepID=UPI002ACD89A4|nr:adhesion G-protein coupled receptor G1-like isoform X1 [Phycodurus eques]
MSRWLLAWSLAFLACCNGVPRHSKGQVATLDEGQGHMRGDNPIPGAGEGTEECPNESGRKTRTGGTECDNEGIHRSCTVSGHKRGLGEAERCMAHVNTIVDSGKPTIDFEALERLEKALARTEVNETTSMFVGRVIALLLKPGGRHASLDISASDSQAEAGMTVNNSKVSVQLPRELHNSWDDTILFCMVTWPHSIWNVTSQELYQKRLLSLSVRGKAIAGLKERVNITVNTIALNETQSPRCAFWNSSTKTFSSSGCRTVWERGQSHVTCSCDHLTYFAVLIVSAPLSDTNEAVLSYISLIGCSLSLFALVITLLLFINKRQIREDVSMKVHVNLAVALILLNAHFLPSQAAALSAP